MKYNRNRTVKVGVDSVREGSFDRFEERLLLSNTAQLLVLFPVLGMQSIQVTLVVICTERIEIFDVVR